MPLHKQTVQSKMFFHKLEVMGSETTKGLARFIDNAEWGRVLVAEFSLLVVEEFLLSSREDDTRSWGNFLVYFSQKLTQTPYQPAGLGLHIYRLLASQAYAKMLV